MTVDTCGCYRCAKEHAHANPLPAAEMWLGGLVDPRMQRMVLCSVCGNKRCPHAADHRNECTGSNEPGQAGSHYPAPALQTAERVKALEEENARLREALEPSGYTKAAYIGEIQYSYVDWDEFGDERTVTRTLEWTTTKEVMAMIRSRALAPASGDGEAG